MQYYRANIWIHSIALIPDDEAYPLLLATCIKYTVSTTNDPTDRARQMNDRDVSMALPKTWGYNVLAHDLLK